MSLHDIIHDIDTLEPFPQTAMQLISLVGDESRALAEVVDIVRTDANLASNVLRLANSAYFGLKRQVDSLDRAVMLLGGQMILEIALFSNTSRAFQAPQEGYALRAGELWRHAMVSAIFARDLAKQNGLNKVDAVFTAALIKDIGKVLLNRFMADAALEIDDLVEKGHMPFFEAEKKVLGIDHAELGALAFEKWGLPEKLVLMVRNHHLQKAPVVAPRETCIIYLADTICSMLGFGAGKDGLRYPFSDELLVRYFGIQDFQGMVTRLFLRLGNLQDLMAAL